MKRIFLSVVSTALIVVLLWFSYLQHLHTTYVDRAITEYTGISHYQVIQKVHAEELWFVQLRINRVDGAQLLKKYPFKDGFDKAILSGRVQNPYVMSCPTCSYYMEPQPGPYDYRLFILNHDADVLYIYEDFGS